MSPEPVGPPAPVVSISSVRVRTADDPARRKFSSLRRSDPCGVASVLVALLAVLALVVHADPRLWPALVLGGAAAVLTIALSSEVHVTKLLARLPRPLVHAIYAVVALLVPVALDALASWEAKGPTQVALVAAAVALLRAAEGAITPAPTPED